MRYRFHTMRLLRLRLRFIRQAREAQLSGVYVLR